MTQFKLTTPTGSYTMPPREAIVATAVSLGFATGEDVKPSSLEGTFRGLASEENALFRTEFVGGISIEVVR